MSDKMKKLFVEAVASRLTRKSITTCSRWAETYRTMGPPVAGPWRFTRHPWLRELHDVEGHTEIVVKKAAQLGFSEMALNRAFYTIDVLGTNVLYVLPCSVPDVKDFTASRFDPALELSPHLRTLFSDVSNLGHKRAGCANLFIRGSRSRSQMKSVPAECLIFDEYDEMNQKNVVLALERASGQQRKRIYKISTPTIEGRGIDADFRQSTQDHFIFRCPHCSRSIELVYPESLIVCGDNATDPRVNDSHLICTSCKAKLENEEKVNFLATGVWVPQFANSNVKGYTLNQLYSTARAASPVEIAKSVHKAKDDPVEANELYNSKLAMTYVVADARLEDKNLDDCLSSHILTETYSPRTMTICGIDVGTKVFYVNIEEVYNDRGDKFSYDPNMSRVTRPVYIGTVEDFDAIDSLLKRFKISACVIDANPERRGSEQLARRFPDRVWMCEYPNGMSGRSIRMKEGETCLVQVDRTSWMDLSFWRFRNQKIQLPANLPMSYREQLKAPVKVYRKDDYGNPISFYIEGNRADHYAHARLYTEVALLLAMGRGAAQSITGGQ